MTLRILSAICCAFLCAGPFDVALKARFSEKQTAQATSTLSANDAFGVLEYSFSRKPDKAAWTEAVRTAGLKPEEMTDHWRKLTPDGQVSVVGFFDAGNPTAIFLRYFPTSRTPMSDATLTWLYRTSDSFIFVDGDQVELHFAAQSISGGTGSKQRSIVLSMTANTMQASTVQFEWKK